MSNIYCFLGGSGTGKSTIASQIYLPEIKSHTTRQVREGEMGDEYYFVPKEEYDKIDFLEKIEYSGNFYGTSYEEVNKYVNSNQDCYAVLNREGCEIFKTAFGNRVKIIYVTLPLEEMASRMRDRGDSEESIVKRIQNAIDNNETENYDIADCVVTNINLKESVKYVKMFINYHKRVYISGKITGLSKEEYENNFQKAEDYLKSLGYVDIVNPVKLKPHNNIEDWQGYMRSCVRELATCDEVSVIRGWETSKGAQEEVRLAGLLGIQVSILGCKC